MGADARGIADRRPAARVRLLRGIVRYGRCTARGRFYLTPGDFGQRCRGCSSGAGNGHDCPHRDPQDRQGDPGRPAAHDRHGPVRQPQLLPEGRVRCRGSARWSPIGGRACAAASVERWLRICVRGIDGVWSRESFCAIIQRELKVLVVSATREAGTALGTGTTASGGAG